MLILIMHFRLHAFVSLVLVSLLTALAAGIPFAKVVPTLLEGFGGTLASVALLVGFGAMIGRMLEVSGGAQVLADRLINKFGENRAPFALGVASLLFGFPIFFDAGLVVMLPIIFSVALRFGGSVLLYALPSAGAFAVMHAFVPPHPGPVAAGDLLGADIGLLLLMGLISYFGLSLADYQAGAHPIHLLLEPAVVALAIPLYQQASQIRARLKPILICCSLSVLISILVTFVTCSLMPVPPEIVSSIATRSIGIVRRPSFRMVSISPATFALSSVLTARTAT